MKRKKNLWKPNKCIKCGEPCMKSLCRKCYEDPKTKHKGQLGHLHKK